MLVRLTRVLDRLTVYPENMRRNLGLTGGLFFSQQVMLALARKGLSREDAYRLVQRNAMRAWSEGSQLQGLLQQDPEVTQRLDSEELAAIFNINYHLKHVDTIFSQVFGE